jgi:hypothetical protein
MDCREAEQKLSWYLDGESPEVDEHLRGCDACRAKLEELKKADVLLSEAARRMLPGDGPQFAVRTEMAPPPRVPPAWHRRGAWSLLSAAAALAIAMLGWNIREDGWRPQVQIVTVLGSSEWIEGAEGLLRVFVTNGQTGAPIQGAEVVATLEGASVMATSGADGSAEVRMPAPSKEGSHVVLTVMSPFGADSVKKSIRVRRPVRILVSTDKPLYQPSQTVHVRALAMNDVLMRPWKGELSLEIEDANGNKVLRKSLQTSEFGIASADLDLADEVVMGTWRVRAGVAGAESVRTFDVKRYSLPKFRVDLATDRTFYAPGERVTADVDANYIFGKPCSFAEVRLEAAQWVADDFKTLATASKTADVNGRARVEFDLPAKVFGTELGGGDAHVRLEATVTDAANHVERKSVILPVSAQGLHIAAIPEGGAYVQGLAGQQMYVVTTWPDGRPARCSVSVAGGPEQATDNLGVLVVPIPGPEFALAARDASGRRIQTRADLRALFATDVPFLLRTDKTSYRAGETMRVAVLALSDGTVYLDVTRGPMTLLTKSLQIEKGRGELDVDLPPDAQGALRVSAYRIWRDGRVHRDSTPVLVDLAEGLTVRPAVRKPEFRPGEDIEADVEVVDGKGRPVPSALGVAVVDEAVFALNEARPGLERTFFAIQEDLLKPRFQLKDAAAPAAMAPRLAMAQKAPADVFSQENLEAKISRLVGEHRKLGRDVLTALSWCLGLVVAVWLAWILFPARPATGVFLGLAVGATVTLAVLPHRADGREALALVAALSWIGALGALIEGWKAVRTVGNLQLGCLLVSIGLVGLIVLLPSLAAARKSADRRLFAGSAAAPESAMLDARKESPPTGRDGSEKPGMKSKDGAASGSPRIREYFPETLYWNPQIVTDDRGRAVLRFPGADSITTWRMAASAVSRDGRLGSADAPIRVFQPFFVDLDLPLALTQGDEVWIPVAVYNYLEVPQSVTLAFEAKSGFDVVGASKQSLDVKPGDVTSVYFHVRARDFGRHRLEVVATGTEFGDAVRRAIDVQPDGRELPFAAGDALRRSATARFTIDPDAIDGASRAWVRLFPSSFSEVVAGLEGLVRMPYG